MSDVLPRRRKHHLTEYDYSNNNMYFVTICTQDRRQLLSVIAVGEGRAPPEIKLSVYGELVKEQLFDLQKRFSMTTIENYVIMPNHIHFLLRLENTGGASPSPTLHDIICAFKSLTARCCKQKGLKDKLWQRSYYEHIVRGENDFLSVWEYIDQNPARWSQDEYYN
ncbi:MAG: transposase [Ruminococcus sp.]|nr:transposase [Ruminococcus sp.]